jgi:hypothetical protein
MPRRSAAQLAPRLAAAVAAGAALACADANAPAAAGGPPDAARLLGAGAGSATFVLASAGALTEPVATFDLVCPAAGGAGVARQVTVVFDTLTLRADGTARRAFASEYWTEGGAGPAGRTHSVAVGGWAARTYPANWRYFGGKSGVALTLSSEGRPRPADAPAWHLLLDGAGRLTAPMPLGGHCSGAAPSSGNAREAEAVYTRR